jgi:hypothetical protein
MFKTSVKLPMQLIIVAGAKPSAAKSAKLPKNKSKKPIMFNFCRQAGSLSTSGKASFRLCESLCNIKATVEQSELTIEREIPIMKR